MTQLQELLTQLKSCRHCADRLEPNPVWHGNEHAPILQVSQAPGQKVHASGVPFSDQSGRRLRQSWYQVTDEEFYDPYLFFLTSVGHCYPGKARSGDKKPPRCCYDLWVKQEVALKPDTRLMIVIGQEAASRFFPGEPFSRLVFEDREVNGIPCYVLPHPSPRNVRWFRDHPEFEARRIVQVREAIRKVIEEEKEKRQEKENA